MIGRYFDNNATTPLDAGIANALWNMRHLFGNPSSAHRYGSESRVQLDTARRRVAEFLGAKPDEIIFTSGGSESNNLAIKGWLGGSAEHRGHLITSAIEHPSVLEVIRYSEHHHHYDCTYLPVDSQGIVDIDLLCSALRDDTRLVSIMLANNEIGSIQPIRDMARIARSKGIFFHTDAVQAIGKLKVNVEDLGVDALSLSGHKFGAPKGVGALYLREGRSIVPLIHGGHQENGARGGTENLFGVIGLGLACEQLAASLKSDIQRYAESKSLLLERIHNIRDCTINGPLSSDNSLPNTVNICCRGVRGEALAAYLSENYHIAISVGSACGSNNGTNLSHVLEAIGLAEDEIRSSVRISLGQNNRREDVVFLADALETALSHLRQLLPADPR